MPRWDLEWQLGTWFLRCRLKTENGASSSRAYGTEADEGKMGMAVGQPVTQNGGLTEEVPAEALRALRDVGFEADSTRHIISHEDLQ